MLACAIALVVEAAAVGIGAVTGSFDPVRVVAPGADPASGARAASGLPAGAEVGAGAVAPPGAGGPPTSATPGAGGPPMSATPGIGGPSTIATPGSGGPPAGVRSTAGGRSPTAAAGAGPPAPTPPPGAGLPIPAPPAGAGPPIPTPPPGAGLPAPGAGYAWPLLPPPAVLTPFGAPADPFGPGHRGVDLAGVLGQPVLAARAGTVVFAGPVAGLGVVSIDHDDGLRTTYEPVDPLVTAGQRVAAGTVVGTLAAGHPGCRQVCLHWGVRRDRLSYLDPLVLLRPPHVRLLPVPDPWPDG